MAVPDHSFWVAIPNFVDTEVFRPCRDVEERRAARRALGLAEEAWVIGTAAAVKRTHKRLDHLVREFAGLRDGLRAREDGRDSYLLIAGSRTDQTQEVLRLAESAAPGRVRMLLDVPRREMPRVLRCMDVFVLASLFEMMPIAVIEAAATGLPLVLHPHPVLQWIGGDGGRYVPMDEEGRLAEALADLNPDRMAALGGAARARAERMFRRSAVVPQYVEYYERITAGAEEKTAKEAGEERPRRAPPQGALHRM